MLIAGGGRRRMGRRGDGGRLASAAFAIALAVAGSALILEATEATLAACLLVVVGLVRSCSTGPRPCRGSRGSMARWERRRWARWR